jgi:diguanylate cyclase (GGDEF)-like protein
VTQPARHPSRAVGLLVAAALAGGLWINLAVLGFADHGIGAFAAPFLIATVAFAVTEAVVMHVELGKNAHSVSLAELTLTVSLFFLPMPQLPLARLLGGGVVLVLVRKQRPLKLAFNLSLWVLDVAVASLVFQTLGGSLNGGTPRMVVPALAAALAASLVDSLAVNVVIAATSFELDLTRALKFVQTCVLGALGCATAALICVGAMAQSAWLLVPIALVVALYLFGFHHFGILRAQHANVQVMYEFAAELGRISHSDPVIGIVLRRVTELLRAEKALLYQHDPETGQLSLTVRSEEGRNRTMQVDVRKVPPLLSEVMRGDEAVVLRSGSRDEGSVDLLRWLDAKDAVIAPLSGEQDLHGALVLTDRLGEVTTFGKDDALLLQALTTHAVAALANSRLVERLDHESMHDSLTGLANRARFQDQLTQALRRTGEGVAVLLMDLDRFKEVNDTLGHHHGDLLLQEIGLRLRRQMRQRDLLARLGGDEFAVLMTGLDQDAAVTTAERLQRALNEPMRLHGVEMEVAASIGVVHVPAGRPGNDQEATLLLQRADVAMYAAKQHYTGVHLYLDELDGYSPRRLALASGLRAAIEQGQMSLRYQPQARLSDGVVVGVEALVRWEHPVYGTVPPDDFISIAEQTGQIRELTRFVLDAALSDRARWAAGGTPLSVSVNLSVRNLMEPDLVGTVQELLQRHRVPAGQLTLEITESHLMSDPTRTAEVVRGLSALGTRLSIDDFGTGYSSLAYLKQLPVSEVKVDKSFVRDLAEDADDAAIVEAIIGLAHTLRLEVIAEGVEDERSEARLRELGCDLLQGYHLARPMRGEELIGWLGASRLHQLRALPAPRASEAAADEGRPGQVLSIRRRARRD